MTKRWPKALLALVLALLGAGLMVALFSRREIKGSIPGRAPISSLGALADVRVVSTDDGVFVSRDDRTWSFVPRFGSGPSLVASDRGGLRVRTSINQQSSVWTSSDFSSFDQTRDEAPPGSSMALANDTVYVSDSSSGIVEIFVIRSGATRTLDLSGRGPTSSLALSVRSLSTPRLLSGTIDDGLWEVDARDGGRWLKILGTPVSAVAVDPSDTERIFIGTPGGLLVSTNAGRSWSFTELRLPVEGLAFAGDELFAVTSSRLIYSSNDGLTGWISRSLS